MSDNSISVEEYNLCLFLLSIYITKLIFFKAFALTFAVYKITSFESIFIILKRDKLRFLKSIFA